MLALWHRCPDCEVCWRGTDDECWNCGRMVHADLDGAPHLTSMSGFGTAMPETHWTDVRREIGVE